LGYGTKEKYVRECHEPGPKVKNDENMNTMIQTMLKEF